jgi:hypothetical protein
MEQSKEELERRIKIIDKLEKIVDFTKTTYNHDTEEARGISKEEYKSQIMNKQKDLLCALIRDCNDLDQLTVMCVFDAVVCDKRFVNRDSLNHMGFEPLPSEEWRGNNG